VVTATDPGWAVHLYASVALVGRDGSVRRPVLPANGYGTIASLGGIVWVYGTAIGQNINPVWTLDPVSESLRTLPNGPQTNPYQRWLLPGALGMFQYHPSGSADVIWVGAPDGSTGSWLSAHATGAPHSDRLVYWHPSRNEHPQVVDAPQPLGGMRRSREG